MAADALVAQPTGGGDPGRGSESTVASGGPPYEALRSDVLAGRFAAGELLQEAPLAERYRVSRTPIRESLARLEHDGLVERAGRGYRVKSGTAEDVVEIYEARIALEAQAAASAADRRTELDLARLRHLHHLAGSAADGDQRRAANADWHVALWKAAHNATIAALLTRLTAQLRIYDRGTHETAEDLDLTDQEHAEILAAIEAHDSDRACSTITLHLRRSRDVRIEQFVRTSVAAP